MKKYKKLPKFTYFYCYLKLINKNKSNEFLKWFKIKIIFKLRKEMFYFKITNELIDQLISPRNQDKI